MGSIPGVLALTWPEAQARLAAAGVVMETVFTGPLSAGRPEAELRVVRCRRLPGGRVEVVLTGPQESGREVD